MREGEHCLKSYKVIVVDVKRLQFEVTEAASAGPSGLMPTPSTVLFPTAGLLEFPLPELDQHPPEVVAGFGQFEATDPMFMRPIYDHGTVEEILWKSIGEVAAGHNKCVAAATSTNDNGYTCQKVALVSN